MKTESEMSGFLREAGYSHEEISEAMDELREMNYLNDKRYVREYYRYGREKFLAENRIVVELQRKGIDKEISEIEIDDYKDSSEFHGPKDDNSYALKVGIKMANNHLEEGKLMDENFFGRVGRRLTGLGYRERTVYYVLDRLRHGGHQSSNEMEGLELDEQVMLKKIELMQEELENRIRDQVEEEEKKARAEEYYMVQVIKNNRNDD